MVYTDIVNNGWQDFFITNGFPPTSSANVLCRNNADGTFEDATKSLPGGASFDGRGVAFADYDEDGDLDLMSTSGVGLENRLWRNDSVTPHHWIAFKLHGASSNRSAVGARIEVSSGARVLVQEVSSGAGRGSFNSLPVEFGLGFSDTVDSIQVRWPNGFVQVLEGPELDAYHDLYEADLVVDFADLELLVDEWGQADSIADMNGDGVVDELDVQVLLDNSSA